MKDPLKQGLKPEQGLVPYYSNRDVEVKDPLKQGLKPKSFQCLILLSSVEVKDPLKQGLKLHGWV